MHTSYKKLFLLVFILFLITQPAQAGWKDYFPSSFSFDTKNFKKWTIPAIGIGALVGYSCYKYLSKTDTSPQKSSNTVTWKTAFNNDVIIKNGLLIPIFIHDVIYETDNEILINGKKPTIIEPSHTFGSVKFIIDKHISSVNFPPYITNTILKKNTIGNLTSISINGDINFINEVECCIQENILTIQFTNNSSDLRKAYKIGNQPLCKIEQITLGKKQTQEKQENTAPRKTITTNIQQLTNVLSQSDPSSCGFHSLKNGIIMLNKLLSPRANSFENELKSETYLYNVISRFKPLVINMRKKIALQEYIQKNILEPCLIQKNDETYKSAIANCASGIAEQALQHLENISKNNFNVPNTTAITLLHASIPSIKRQTYPLERCQQDFSIEQDIVITRDIIENAFYTKYLPPILKTYQIKLSEDELLQLITSLKIQTYDNVVFILNVLKDSDSTLLGQLKPIHEKMQQAENIESLLLTETSIKHTWLQAQLKKHSLSFPENKKLLDAFIANPYIFADIQGFWLEGDELRHLIKQGCDISVKKFITVIDSIDELTTKEFLTENSRLAGIKHSWCNFEQYTHAFIINTASQQTPEVRGHWFVVLINKTNNTSEFIVINSENKNRQGLIFDKQGIAYGETICDYVDYVKILKNYLQI